MAKALRTAALVVGAVALAATGVGLALGATVASTTIVAAGVSVATLASAASFGAGVLSLAAGLTASKPKQSVAGNPEQFAADPDAFVPYGMGRTATSGNIVFRRAWDTADKGDNDRQAFGVILSGAGPIQGVESFKADNVAVGFGAGGAAIGSFAGFMWQTTQLGACPAPSAMSFGAGGTPPGWTAGHKLSGYAAAAWTLRFDSKGDHYGNGVPKPQWVILGVKVWDPRQDSTYPGGSGACRALNEATYVYSTNPFLHGLTWALGRWQNGKRVLGVGAPIAGIDVASFVEGANIADANGWQVGGFVYSGDPKWGALKSILQAGMGEPLQLGSKISCFVNAPKVSLATITGKDLSAGATVTATQPRRSRINGVIPRYRSEDHDWRMVPASVVRVADYVTLDGGQRTKEIPYPLIQDATQAAVAARYDIENAREFGPIVLPLRTWAVGYRPGDCITADIPELGLNSQPILITNRGVEPSTLLPTLTARSETAGKHPFALGQTGVAPPTPTVTGPPLVPAPAGTAWDITGTSITTGTVTVPALVVEGAVDSTTAQAIVFEYRAYAAGQDLDAGWISAGAEPPTTTRKVIPGVQNATAYEVSVRYQRNGQLGGRLVLGPEGTAGYQLAATYVRHTTGETAEQLKPAEGGADVTGNHKSYDTDRVGGVPATNLLANISDLLIDMTAAEAAIGASATVVTEAKRLAANSLASWSKNPTFGENWTIASPTPSFPPQYGSAANDGGAYIGKSNQPGIYSPNALQIDRNGVNSIVVQMQGTLTDGSVGIPITPGKAVIEATVRFEDGAVLGSGIGVTFFNGNGVPIGSALVDFYADDIRSNGTTGNLSSNQTLSFSKMVEVPSGSTFCWMYLCAGTSTFSPTYQGYLRTIWHKALIRAAVDGEIKAGKAISDAATNAAAIALEASTRSSETGALATRATNVEARAGALEGRVTTTESSLALVNGRVQSYWQTTVVAGSGRAQVTIYATDGLGGFYGGVDIVGDVAIHGGLITSGTIVAAKFVTDQGVDLAAIVPGATNTAVSASQIGSTSAANDGLGNVSGNVNCVSTSPVTMAAGDSAYIDFDLSVTSVGGATAGNSVKLVRVVNGVATGSWTLASEITGPMNLSGSIRDGKQGAGSVYYQLNIYPGPGYAPSPPYPGASSGITAAGGQLTVRKQFSK